MKFNSPEAAFDYMREHAEQIRACPEDIVVMRRTRTAALAALALDRRTREHMKAFAERKPKAGPKYGIFDEEEMQTNYSRALVREGVGRVVAELEAAAYDPDITKAVHDAESAARQDGRLTSFERDHDLGDFVRVVASTARDLSAVRCLRREHEEWRPRGAHRSSLGDRMRAHGTPRQAIEGLAHAAVMRLWPAAQNIISRLPQAERQAAAEETRGVLMNLVRKLSRLHTLVWKSSDEYKRWAFGFGAVDLAIVECDGVVNCLAELAQRAGSSGDSIKLRAEEAREAMAQCLDDMGVERFETTRSFVWQRRKADMAEFARGDGGMTPDLEVRYHAPGSKFLAM